MRKTRKKTYVNGKKYRLYCSAYFEPNGNESEYEVLYNNNRFQLLQYGKPLYNKWFSTLKVLLRTDENEVHGGCLVFVSEDGEHGRVLDIVKDTWLTEDIGFTSIKVVEKYCKSYLSNKDEEECYVEILDKKNKRITLYSSEKGIIFGPRDYTNIEFDEFGYILDDSIILEYSGYSKELNGYELKCSEDIYEVYYNKEKDEHFILAHCKNGGCLYDVESESSEINIEINEHKLIYNKEDNTLKIKSTEFYGWTDRDYRDAFSSAFEDDSSALWNVDDQEW